MTLALAGVLGSGVAVAETERSLNPRIAIAEEGETLDQIAERVRPENWSAEGPSYAALIERLNGISPDEELAAGKQVILPRHAGIPYFSDDLLESTFDVETNSICQMPYSSYVGTEVGVHNGLPEGLAGHLVGLPEREHRRWFSLEHTPGDGTVRMTAGNLIELDEGASIPTRVSFDGTRIGSFAELRRDAKPYISTMVYQEGEYPSVRLIVKWAEAGREYCGIQDFVPVSDATQEPAYLPSVRISGRTR